MTWFTVVTGSQCSRTPRLVATESVILAQDTDRNHSRRECTACAATVCCDEPPTCLVTTAAVPARPSRPTARMTTATIISTIVKPTRLPAGEWPAGKGGGCDIGRPG